MLLSITGGGGALISMLIAERLNEYIYFPVSYVYIPLLSATISLCGILITILIQYFISSRDWALINKIIIVTFWASLPLTVRQLVRGVYMLSFGVRITAPGLSSLAEPFSLFSIALEQIDIYMVWFFANLYQVIPLYDENLDRAKTLLISFLALLIFRMLVKIILTEINSGFIFILFS
jgi:hypothetical protein